MKHRLRKNIPGLLLCLILSGCTGNAVTEGEKDHEQFLKKAENVLGENHRKFLDYRTAVQDFQQECGNGAAESFNENGEMPIGTVLEDKILRTKKVLYESLAEKNKLELIPARLAFRCVLSEGKPQTQIEVAYEEEEEKIQE